MVKQIIFCTLRNNNGATGGPGGVLYLQMITLGSEILGVPCLYKFNKIKVKYHQIGVLLNKLLFKLLFKGKKHTYFFTHDIEMAALLADLGLPYSLIFHQQGPVVLEQSNMGHKLTAKMKKYYQETERRAFVNARTLHFPSNGAADMYFASEYANCKREEVNLYSPLYNIIPQISPVKPVDLDLKYEDQYITLFSLGTLTVAKGQDQTVKFIGEYVKKSSKPLRYLLVGRGPLRDQLITELEEIKKENPSFVYQYFESLSHEAVMYVHKISDVYIMLHRISIFDFAILEAMSQYSAVILSKVGGNLDFNKEQNVIFAEDTINNSSLLANMNISTFKQKNYDVICRYFSKKAFIKQYEAFFKSIIVNEN